MYGMEEQAKKKTTTKASSYTYEIEKELQDPQLKREIVGRCDGRINNLKLNLRSGVDSDSYEKANLLLQGYIALKRVITKCIQSR